MSYCRVQTEKVLTMQQSPDGSIKINVYNNYTFGLQLPECSD